MSANPSDEIAAPDTADGARLYDPDQLTDFVTSVFAAHGLLEGDAARAGKALVAADLRGVWSHGVSRTPMYCARLAKGVANPAPELRVQSVAPAAGLLDGKDGLGLIVAPFAMDAAVSIAQVTGVGLVGVKSSGHFGMAALYAEQAAEANCLGWAFTNASPAMPPHGARTAHLGTNPMAFSAPAPEGAAPFLIDMAMTVVARGKLKFAAQRRQPIPEGLAMDDKGRPTTDGAAAFSGTVLPFGGVKGSALSWMMDLACGAYTGAAHAGRVGNPFNDLERPQNVGHLFIAARADLFMPLAEFLERMGEGVATAKALPLAEGSDEILTPGEPEARTMARNRAAGVALTPDVVTALSDLGARAGVEWITAKG